MWMTGHRQPLSLGTPGPGSSTCRGCHTHGCGGNAPHSYQGPEDTGARLRSRAFLQAGHTPAWSPWAGTRIPQDWVCTGLLPHQGPPQSTGLPENPAPAQARGLGGWCCRQEPGQAPRTPGHPRRSALSCSGSGLEMHPRSCRSSEHQGGGDGEGMTARPTARRPFLQWPQVTGENPARKPPPFPTPGRGRGHLETPAWGWGQEEAAPWAPHPLQQPLQTLQRPCSRGPEPPPPPLRCTHRAGRLRDHVFLG